VTVVYVDLLFLENLAVDYLILFTAAYIAGERVPRLRLLLAALLGAAYAVALYVPSLRGPLESPVLKLLCGAAMGLLAYGGKKHALRLTLLFFAAAFAFAGCVFAAALLTGNNVSTRTLAVAMTAMLAAVVLIFGRLARHGGLRRDTRRCRMALGGRESETVALVDTGNSLCDPISGRPVIVVDPEAFLPLLDPAKAAVLRAARDAPSAFLALGGRGLRLIPYHTVRGGGSMLALVPDRVTLGDREVKNVLLGLSPTALKEGCGALVGDI